MSLVTQTAAMVNVLENANVDGRCILWPAHDASQRKNWTATVEQFVGFIKALITCVLHHYI
jgi:hypothetical protein